MLIAVANGLTALKALLIASDTRDASAVVANTGIVTSTFTIALQAEVGISTPPTTEVATFGIVILKVYLRVLLLVERTLAVHLYDCESDALLLHSAIPLALFAGLTTTTGLVELIKVNGTNVDILFTPG